MWVWEGGTVESIYSRKHYVNGEEDEKTDWKEILRETFLDPSVFLLVGALIIAIAAGKKEDTFHVVLLSVGASYIAVSTTMRLYVPQANPRTYIPLRLSVTFAFNISLGIPLYYFLITMLCR
jgi:hypothetical protein